MFRNDHLLLSLFLMLFTGVSLYAQDAEPTPSDTESKSKGSKLDEYPYPDVRTEEWKQYVRKKKHDQQDKFLDRNYTHPAPPKHMWELGIDLGGLRVSGDINSQNLKSAIPFTGFGVGAHVRKAFGYVFSMRLSGWGGRTQGFNWRGNQGWSGDFDANGATFTHNTALAGDTAKYGEYNDEFNGKVPNYLGLNKYVVFYNYQTKIRNGSLEALVNLNNIKFHKRRNCWSIHAIFGVGAYVFNTKMDMLDADGNEYDFSRISEIGYDTDENRKEVKKELRALTDGTFESQAQFNEDDYWFFGMERKSDHPWTFRPNFDVGLGFQIKLSRRINLGVESKVYFGDEDLLDGQEWQEWGAQTKDWDRPVFTNASLNFNLGGKNTVEPLWWMNPLDYAYEELDNKPCCDDIKMPDLADDDNDGVPNLFDVEPNSREDCPVDTKGRMLDSDGDGILDCDDCQPYTPKHLITKINDCGAAFDNCCDSLAKLIKNMPPPVTTTVNPCNDSMLPNVLFDLGKSNVKKEFGGQLQSVANYLMSNSAATLCVVGYTDNRGDAAANNRLSWDRANNVVNELVKLGVGRHRLKVQYRGEDNPVVGGLSDAASKKGIDAEHALNRRVDFDCCMEGQMDMPRPGN